MDHNPYEAPAESDYRESQDLPASLMNSQQKIGQVVLLVWISLMLAYSVGVIVLFYAVRGAEPLPGHFPARLVMNAALCFWLYRGSVAAKWIMVVVYGFGGMISLSEMPPRSDNALGFVIMLAMGSIYVSFAVVLLLVPGVNAFLAYRREQRKGSRS